MKADAEFVPIERTEKGMSYLHPLRLHFAREFRADVSAVNNEPGHYDNNNLVPTFPWPRTVEFEDHKIASVAN